MLLFMTGFAIFEALRIDADSHAMARATRLADAYGRARFAVASEESWSAGQSPAQLSRCHQPDVRRGRGRFSRQRPVLDVDEHQVDPLFAVIEVSVDRAAAAHRSTALRETTELSDEASAIKLATPAAFLLGVALPAFFLMLLRKEARREATREAEVLILGKAALEDSLTGRPWA